ncbi:MAG: ABC transporter permease [Clostridia bacterium]|nr:ABC transporter permease [Clostridia bacterium]
MNKVFKKLTKRTFISNFKQFISVILIVFLASMLLSGLVTNYSTLNKVINTYFEETNLADAWFYVDKVTIEDEEFFEKENIKFDKRYYFESNLNVVDSSVSNNGKVYVYDGKISTPYKESGMWGCIIDKKVAEDNKIKVGFDELTINLKYEYCGEVYELNLEFLITGTGSLDECADVNSSWPVFITKDLFLNELNYCLKEITRDSEILIEDAPYNQILVKAINNETVSQNVDDIIKKVEDYYKKVSPNNLVYSFKQNTIDSVIVLTDEIKQTRKMIYVFPLIFLFVSVLVILTTIDQLVLQEKQKIGTLKSIGIPNKKIIRHYSKFGAILCIIGSIAGSFFGVLMIPPIMFIKYNLVYSLPNEYMRLSIPYHLILLVILGVTLLGYIVARIACQSIMRKKPIDCLKFQVSSSKSFSKRSKRNKKSKLLRKLPFSFKMALRNIKLKPIRTFMAIIGIAGCFALLLCGFGIGDTLKHSVSYDLGNNFRYDITTTYESKNFEEKIKELNGLKNYEVYEKLYVNLKSKSLQRGINLYKINENSTLTNIKLQKKDVFVSKSIADEFNIIVGDEIVVSLGDINKNLVVTNIIKTSVLNGIYICDELGFEDIYKIKGMWINCDNVTQEKINFINEINGTNTATTLQDSISSMNTKISSVSVMTSTLKVFAVALAIVVLFNLVFLISKERIREIATLKVIGRNISSIVFSLFLEILFMGVIGCFLGVFLGYPLLLAVLSINKVNILSYVSHIGFLSYFFSYLIVVLTVFSIMGICYLNVKRINMIESLKSME